MPGPPQPIVVFGGQKQEPGIDAARTLQAIPSDDYVKLIEGTCVVSLIYICNTSGAALDVCVHDGQDTPLKLVPTVSMPSPSAIFYPFDQAKILGGLWWKASAPGATGYVVAYKK